MKTPLSLLQKKNRRLTEIPNDFLKKLAKIQREQLNFILAKLSDLKKSGGFISIENANLLLVDELRDELKDYLLKGDYTTVIREFAKEFNLQKAENNKYYGAEFGKEVSTEFGDQIVKTIQRQTVESLVTDSVTKDFLTPLEGILNNAVASGSGYQETLEYIRTFVDGSDEVDGAILKYSKQLAHDSFANADRAYGNAIADELDLDWFLWAGDEIETSRCICIRNHGKYFHYKEIEAMGRGENVGDCGYPWAGMNRNTNEKTIFNYAGGYGCMHSIAGVSVFNVPKDDIQRNIENGNYEPVEAELELLEM